MLGWLLTKNMSSHLRHLKFDPHVINCLTREDVNYIFSGLTHLDTSSNVNPQFDPLFDTSNTDIHCLTHFDTLHHVHLVIVKIKLCYCFNYVCADEHRNPKLRFQSLAISCKKKCNLFPKNLWNKNKIIFINLKNLFI